jgi:transposase, IS30 family
MGRRGPGALPQVEKREHYAQLIAQGYNNSKACRIAGINRRTGKRWRHGRTITTRDGRKLHYAAVVGTGAGRREISPRYLSEDERVRIADLRRAGNGVRAIAESAGRSPSTISRELRRNRDPGSGQYRPFTAHKLAVKRRGRPRAGKIAADEVLRRFVQERLEQRWSPEQVSQALRREFPDDPARHVVHETIYQAVYRPGLGGLPRELPARVLRTRRRRRQPRRRADQRRPNGIIAMTMHDQRPAEAADRAEPGHWEGDLITGEFNRSAIGTLVDRFSRFTILLHLPGRHTAEAVRDALVAAFWQLRRSLTWDQGKELALHAGISAALGMPVYFCDKASPWQRPSSENTNGLPRQYFPKRTSLSASTPEDLRAVEERLNNRPRKTLNWQTPAAIFNAALLTGTQESDGAAPWIHRGIVRQMPVFAAGEEAVNVKRPQRSEDERR